MKVLLINSICGVGSTGTIATYIRRNLNEQGQERFVANGGGLTKNCDRAIQLLLGIPRGIDGTSAEAQSIG